MYVTRDSHSSYVFVPVHYGKYSRNARKHWLSVYTAIRIPDTLETDNGPANTFLATPVFLQEWGIDML